MHKTLTMTKTKEPATLKKAAHRGRSKQKTELVSAERSADIAHCYGFSFIEAPAVTKDDFHKTKHILGVELSAKDEHEYDSPVIRPEEKVALLRTYLEKGMERWAQPVMLYYEGFVLPEGIRRKHRADKIFHLDIVDTTKSVAEAIIIKTTLEILKDEGYKNLSVRINTIGDRESMTRFCRELAAYYRKNINLLSPHCRQALKKDAFDVYSCTDEKCKEIKEKAPSPISYLSEPSRQHFKEVLEYLETLHIEYVVDNNLICHKKIWSQTAFEIRDEDAQRVIAVGSRYNGVAKRIGFRKEAGAIGVTVMYPPLRARKASGLKRRKKEQPKIYFVQLGFDAKLKSLEVIEMIRQAKVPIAQSLGRDKIGSQMQAAENSKAPYAIIMGQKEAQENSVIVRSMANRSQETVSLANLPAYLAKMK